MRIAVVDIGTNSTRLLIADTSGAQVTAEPVRLTTVTRLGDGVDADGRLREDAMERVFATLDRYREEIDRADVDKAVAILTSAVRDAANGREFADVVKERYGLESRILSGDEEGQMTYLGATSERDPADPTPIVVIDIGGGSTEFVIGVGREVSFHVSTQAGAVRQSERHLYSDPPPPVELDEMANDVRATLAAGVPAEQRNKVRHAIAVAGTATSMAAMALRLDPYDPAKVQGYVLSNRECKRLVGDLAELTLAQRREITGLDPERAPTIVAGSLILLEAMRLFGLTQIEISEHDILRGAALALAGE